MKKKLLITVLLSFMFISGFTANYNLTIDKDIQEDISINIFADDLDENNKVKNLLTLDQYAILGQESKLFYDKKITENATRTKLEMRYTYSYKDFKNARYANTCFDSKTYINKNDYIYFRGYGGFYCLYQKELRIQITTDKLVMTHNANIVEDNTYIWKVTNDNKNKFELEFQVATNKTKEEAPKPTIKVIGIFKIVIGVIVGVAVVVIFITLRKEQKRNYM